MSINTTKLLSGRSPVVPYANLDSSRYQFLSLGQAEPNLGSGANNSILTISTDNTRVWTNSLTLSTISATGNISANYFFGNGSQLTGIITSVSNVVNGDSNLTIAAANANITLSVSTVGNVAVFSPTGVSILGTISANGTISTNTIISASGNIIGGNLLTTGLISATSTIASDANITGGNLLTAGLVSATSTITSDANIIGGNLLTTGLISSTSTITSAANITGGNVLTSGLFSSTGNVTGGNIVTTGLVTATGNITGDYFIGNGSQLSGVTATAVYANALLGNTLSSNVIYSSLTSVGTLENLTVDGNTRLSNIVITDTTLSSIGNIVSIAGYEGLGIPYGNTSQRPSGPIVGTTRFNTALDTIETWNGMTWVTSGNVISPGTIVDQQIAADGFANAFNLVQSTTTEAILVSINGVGQTPTSSYTVSGNVITFSETPANGDNIGIRFITYFTSVSSLTNYSGNAIVNINPSGNIQFTTANSLFATMTENSFNVQNSISATGNITGANLSVGTGTVTVGNIVNSNANAVGNIGSSSKYFNTVFAQATSVLFADLAEKYLADAEYAPGTVLSFGGSQELTVSTKDADSLVAGIVSTNPAYNMNSGLSGEHVVTLALVGRVPSLVQGKVTAGDMMVSAGNGRARAESNPKMGTVIGKAITNFDGDVGVIEILVGRI